MGEKLKKYRQPKSVCDRYDQLIAGTSSPTMKAFYEGAKTLPRVIDPKVAKECWDAAWKEYIEDSRLGKAGIRRGNVTVFCNSDKAGEAFARFDEFSETKCS